MTSSNGYVDMRNMHPKALNWNTLVPRQAAAMGCHSTYFIKWVEWRREEGYYRYDGWAATAGHFWERRGIADKVSYAYTTSLPFFVPQRSCSFETMLCFSLLFRQQWQFPSQNVQVAGDSDDTCTVQRACVRARCVPGEEICPQDISGSRSLWSSCQCSGREDFYIWVISTRRSWTWVGYWHTLRGAKARNERRFLRRIREYAERIRRRSGGLGECFDCPISAYHSCKTNERVFLRLSFLLSKPKSRVLLLIS